MRYNDEEEADSEALDEEGLEMRKGDQTKTEAVLEKTGKAMK